MSQLTYAAQTDVGLKRNNNQDAFACYEPYDRALLISKGSLFIVADGMGGHAAGEVASKLAVELIRDAFKQENAYNSSFFLQTSFNNTNTEIYRRGNDIPTLNGMGTTCTAVIIKNNLAEIAHVGDSRAYRVRGLQIEQLTEDHSLVWEMMKNGLISSEEMRKHPKRSVLTQAIGYCKSVKTDFVDPPLTLISGDKLLLCSDGLNEMVTDKIIGEVVSDHEPEKACSKLVNIANSNGGIDNITLIIVKVE